MIILREHHTERATSLFFTCRKCDTRWSAETKEAKITLGYKVFKYSWFLKDRATYTMRCPFCNAKTKSYDKGYAIVKGRECL